MNELQQPQSISNRPSARQFARDVVAMMTMLSIGLAPTSTAAAQPDEYTLKVVYLYNFTRYVSWPAKTWKNEHEDFVIGVIGENPFGQTLDLLAKKKRAQKRRVIVHYFQDLANYKPCHILFVAASTPPEVREAIIRQTRNQPVLLVGESVGYAEAGATVNFMLTPEGAIKFEINIDAMNRRQMQANAQLLKLATVVRDKGAE